VLPVYCFDPRFFDSYDTKFGSRKAGVQRTKFMIESVADFRSNLTKLGSGLLVAHDQPEKYLPKLFAKDDESFVNTLIY
jgi:deoxyribodipyrimidine photolyase